MEIIGAMRGLRIVYLRFSLRRMGFFPLFAALLGTATAIVGGGGVICGVTDDPHHTQCKCTLNMTLDFGAERLR